MAGLPRFDNTDHVIPVTQLATGTPDGTKYVRDDGVFAVPVLALTAGSVGNTELRNSAATSVIGRSANSTGAPADIAATGNGPLRRTGTALGFVLDGTTALATSGAQNVDCSLGDLFTITPAGDTTLTAVNIREGQIISIICLTSGATPYTVTLDASFIAEDHTRSTGTDTATYFHWTFRGLAGGQMIQVGAFAGPMT